MSTDLGLRGRVALVTGGSKGLGLACAQAREGGRVAIASRAQANVDAALARLSGAMGVAANFADSAAALAAIDAVEAHLGPIDLLVNSAGAARRTPVDDLTSADWRAAMDAKYFTYVNAFELLVKRMAARGRGATREPISRSAVTYVTRTQSDASAPWENAFGKIRCGGYDDP